MNGDFHEALAFMFGQECPGGDRVNCKSNTPNDPGKQTNQGVIQTTYDGYRKSLGQPLQSVFQATNDEIDLIYWHRFWTRGGCAQLPKPLNILHFDGCVNIGTEARDARGNKHICAITLLQRALAVPDDGVMGLTTVAAIQNFPTPKYLVMRLWAERVIYYDSLDAKNPALTPFLTGGWLARLRHFYQKYMGV